MVSERILHRDTNNPYDSTVRIGVVRISRIETILRIPALVLYVSFCVLKTESNSASISNTRETAILQYVLYDAGILRNKGPYEY